MVKDFQLRSAQSYLRKDLYRFPYQTQKMDSRKKKRNLLLNFREWALTLENEKFPRPKEKAFILFYFKKSTRNRIEFSQAHCPNKNEITLKLQTQTQWNLWNNEKTRFSPQSTFLQFEEEICLQVVQKYCKNKVEGSQSQKIFTHQPQFSL